MENIPEVENLDNGIKLLQSSVEMITDNLCGLQENIGLLTAIIRYGTLARKKQVDNLLITRAEKVLLEDSTDVFYKIPEMYWRRFERLNGELRFSDSMIGIIPSSLFVTMISQYDAFIGSLIRCIYKIKPETFNAKDKTITAMELMAFESINEAKLHLIDSQIDTILRESHLEQIKSINNIINSDSLEKLINTGFFNKFVEITQRRHLFVHNDGLVSKQYKLNCEKSNCFDNSLQIGTKLKITSEYLNFVKNTLSEVAFLLSYHVFNLKYKNEPDIKYLQWLNHFSISIISREDYQLAEIITTHLVKHKYKNIDKDEENVLSNNLNYAQVLKWQGKLVEMHEVLNRFDWKTKGNKFKLAVAVLSDDFDTASKTMRKIGKDAEEMPQSGYLEWPIFKEFRKSDIFIETFKEIFGDDPTVHDLPYKPVNVDITNKLEELLEH